MTTTPDPDIVPFGKYRDRPVTDLLADRSYVEWLLAQPWFAQRYQPVYNVLIGAGGPEPQDSPEHNAMQARYLDNDELFRLAQVFLPNREELISYAREWRGKRGTSEQLANIVDDDAFKLSISEPTFELRGWDVVFSGGVHLTRPTEREPVPEMARDCPRCRVTEHKPNCLPPGVRPDSEDPNNCFRCRPTRHGDDCLGGSAYQDLFRRWHDEAELLVELKPVIADDFPTVLREVVKRRDTDRARGYWPYNAITVVVADRITPSSVTVQQITTMFASRKVELLLSGDIGTSAKYPLGRITDYDL